MIKKLKTFRRLSASRKAMIFQAFGLSVYTWALFTFFKRFAKFGETTNASGTTDKRYGTKAADISFAIHTVSRLVPWKNVCRHQAYQAKMLCNYYKIPCLIFIGFKKDTDQNKIQAHAWTVADEKIITGFCDPKEYIVQSIYRNKWQ